MTIWFGTTQSNLANPIEIGCTMNLATLSRLARSITTLGLTLLEVHTLEVHLYTLGGTHSLEVHMYFLLLRPSLSYWYTWSLSGYSGPSSLIATHGLIGYPGTPFLIGTHRPLRQAGADQANSHQLPQLTELQSGLPGAPEDNQPNLS